MHLVGFTIEIYYDARPYECQIDKKTNKLENYLQIYSSSLDFVHCLKDILKHEHTTFQKAAVLLSSGKKHLTCWTHFIKLVSVSGSRRHIHKCG